MKRVSLAVTLILLLSMAALKSQDPSVLQLLHQSREAVAAGDLEESLELIERALVLDPAYFPLRKQRARILLLMGRYEAALAEVEEYLSRHPGDGEARFVELRSLIELGRLSSFQIKLRNPTPLDLTADQGLALLLTLLDRPALSPALELFVRRWEGSGQSARLVIRTLGSTLSGELPAAQQGLERLLILGPQRLDARTRRAAARVGILLAEKLNRQGDRQRAESVYRTALQIEPSLQTALRELGWLFREQGRAAEAAATWESGWRYASEPVTWLHWIIEVRLEEENFSEARSLLEEALRRRPSDDLAQARYLLVLRKLGDAEAYQRWAQRLSESNSERGRALGDALILIGEGDGASAVKRMREAQLTLLFPAEYAHARRLWVDQLTGEDRWSEALPLLQEMTAAEGAPAGQWRDLGWAYWSTGASAPAIEAWSRALDLGVDNRRAFVAQVIEQLLDGGVAESGFGLADRFLSEEGLVALGIHYYRAGNFRAAHQVLTRAGSPSSADDYGVFYQAVAGLRTGQPSAFEALLEWIGRSPQQPPTVRLASFTRSGEALTQLGLQAVFATLDETIRHLLAARHPETFAVLEAVTRKWGGQEYFATRLPSYQAEAAEFHFARGELQAARQSAEESLRRLPSQPTLWYLQSRVQRRLGEREAEHQALVEALRYQPPIWLEEAIQGELARKRSEYSTALEFWLSSLSRRPLQAHLRSDAIDLLVEQNRYLEAREMTAFFEIRLASGDDSVRDRVALHREQLGDLAGALEIWDELSIERPDSTAVAIARGSLLTQLCRFEDAAQVIEQPTVGSSEALVNLRVEIDLARGALQDVLEKSAIGLQSYPASLGLLRARLEAAERLGDTRVMQQAATEYLAIHPHSYPVQQALSRALVAEQLWDSARDRDSQLLRRNPRSDATRLRLREIARATGNLADALIHAQELAEQPEDADSARIRFAVSLAESRLLGPALRRLQPFEERPPESAVALLLFEDVSLCSATGRLGVANIVAQLRQLHQQGLLLANFAELGHAAPERPAVVPLFYRTERSVVEIIDRLLRDVGGRGVLIVAEESLVPGTPRLPDLAGVRALQESGRWQIALTDRGEITIDEEGRQGNFWTQSQWAPDGTTESEAQVEQRLEQRLTRLRGLGSQLSSTPLLWFHSRGNRGQLNLDSEEEILAVSSRVLERQFEWLISTGDSGFFDPQSEVRRVSAKRVPSSWSQPDLRRHVIEQNPYREGVLQLARVLSWDGQYPRAHATFQTARERQADEIELRYAWGNNGLVSAEYPSAFRQFSLASSLGFPAHRLESSLERLRWRLHPTADPATEYWEDNEGRDFQRHGFEFGGYVGRHFEIRSLAGWNRWRTSGLGEVEGVDLGFTGLVHLAPEYQLTGQIRQFDFEGSPQAFTSFNVGFEGPIRWLGGWHANGTYRLEVAREQIPTLEAVLDGVLNRRVSLLTHQRINNSWDLFANAHWDDRTDGNRSWRADGRLVRRLSQAPYVGIGYGFRFGDSTFDPPGYFAPEGLQHHHLYFQLRANSGDRFSFALSATPGIAREQNTDTRFVWGARGQLLWVLGRRLTLSLNGSRLQSPVYSLNRVFLGLVLVF